MGLNHIIRCDRCDKEILQRKSIPHETYEKGMKMCVPYCEECFVHDYKKKIKRDNLDTGE